MPTMSIRVEDSLHQRIEDASGGEGLSVSEWMRKLIVSRLGLDEGVDWTAPTTLSKRDRQQLALLHRLIELASADEDEANYHATMAKVLQRGFTGEYPDEFISIDDEMPMSECRLVWDLLDMFRVIKASVDSIGLEKVKQIDKIAEHSLAFRGFDFQNHRESRMAGYTRHLIETDRWIELAEHFDDKHERGNSHSPVLDSYLRMLEVFKPIWAAKVIGADRGRYLLDEAHLRSLVEAAYHPERRPDRQ